MSPRSRRLVKALAHVPVGAACLVPLVAMALVARAATVLHRRRGARPRVVWGVTPLLNLKYWSAALRSRGFTSATFVNGVFAINSRDDFDHVRDHRFWPHGQLDTFKAYPALAWALTRFDVFMFSFDGGFLMETPFWRFESWLLQLAGKRTVLIPYGSDIAVPGHLGPWERQILDEYPRLQQRARATRRRVDHLCRPGNLVVATLQVGYLPRHDVFWSHALAVDVTRPNEASTAPGQGLTLVVAHASNHRSIKGTDDVVRAVEELREKGMEVHLDLLERMSNEVVLERTAAADIVIDQLLCGFGLYAVEAMALGRPVLSHIGWLPEEVRARPSLRRCPIVDVSAETLAATLQALAENPQRLVALGAASAAYAAEFHTLASVGACLEAIVGRAWEGTSVPASLAPLDGPALGMASEAAA